MPLPTTVLSSLPQLGISPLTTCCRGDELLYKEEPTFLSRRFTGVGVCDGKRWATDVGDDNNDVIALIPDAVVLLLLPFTTTDEDSRIARLIPVKYSRRESTLPLDDDDRYAEFEDDDIILLCVESGLVVTVEVVIVVG